MATTARSGDATDALTYRSVFDKISGAKWARISGCESQFRPGDQSQTGARPNFDRPAVFLNLPRPSRQHADLDLDHVQPGGVLGDVMELQSKREAARRGRRPRDRTRRGDGLRA